MPSIKLTTELITHLTSELALAVAQRKPFESTHDGITFSIWYDQKAIPVITLSHHTHGVLFEELASDKPEILADMLAIIYL